MSTPLEAVSGADCVTCSLCDDEGGGWRSASEFASVASNVAQFQHESFTVWRCDTCGSLHSKERVDIDKYYKGYPLLSQKLDYGTWCAFSTRLRLLRRHGLTPGARVLDYGCGAGAFVDFLSDRGYRVVGYDPHNPKYRVGDFAQDTYDAIVTYDVIEHDEAPKAFLRRLSALLRPGGLLVVGTPNADVISLPNAHLYSMELHQPYHRHMLSERALERCGQSADLELRHIRRRFCFDTMYPFINTQFLWRYIRMMGNTLDVTADMPKFSVIVRHPSLIGWGLIGYMRPHRGSMVAFFRKRS